MPKLRLVGNMELLKRLIERAQHEARLLDEPEVELNLDWARQSLDDAEHAARHRMNAEVSLSAPAVGPARQ